MAADTAALLPLLTPEQVAEFNERGFVVLRNLLDDVSLKPVDAAFEDAFAEVKRVASAPEYREQLVADALKNPKGHLIVRKPNGARYTYESVDRTWSPERVPSMETLSVRHVAWCGEDFPAFKQAGLDPRILSVAAQLLGLEDVAAAGGKVTQIINQAHFKAPKDGVKFPWHQDSHHRKMGEGCFVDVNGRGSYVQVIIAVEDTFPDSGPVQFIPYSCKDGHIGGKAGLNPADVIDGTWKGHKAEMPLLKRGDAVCLAGYTIHGSDDNTSDRWRRTFVNGFASYGAQVDRTSVHCNDLTLPPHWFAGVKAAQHPAPAAQE